VTKAQRIPIKEKILKEKSVRAAALLKALS